jgi:hypothetical protein
MAIYYTNASGKILTINNKVLVKAALPDAYDYRGEPGEITEIDLGNNKVVTLTNEPGNEHPHTFSADFSLAVVTDDPSEHDYELVHWGSYSLSEYYMQKTIYLYDLGDTYSFPTGSDGTPAGEYIYAKYTPLARLS